MKFLHSNLLMAGVQLSHPQWARAQDTRLTKEYLSKIMGEARKNYKVPAIAITVMDSKTPLLQEVQGVTITTFPASHIAISISATMASRSVWQTVFWEEKDSRGSMVLPGHFSVVPSLSRDRVSLSPF